jgi:hypothetical protein
VIGGKRKYIKKIKTNEQIEQKYNDKIKKREIKE